MRLESILDWYAQNVIGKNLGGILMRCSLAASVHNLWWEGNQSVSMTVEVLIDRIMRSLLYERCGKHSKK